MSKTLTDTAPALISTKAAVAVAELTLASLRNEVEMSFGDTAEEAQTKVDFLDHALEHLKNAQVWLQMAQPPTEET